MAAFTRNTSTQSTFQISHVTSRPQTLKIVADYLTIRPVARGQ